MTETQQAHAGDWVEVECVLLEPADRSANLPAETAEKPLMMWVKGFAEGRAALGEPVTVETMTAAKSPARCRRSTPATSTPSASRSPSSCTSAKTCAPSSRPIAPRKAPPKAPPRAGVLMATKFDAIMARRGEIMRGALGMDYSEFELSPIAFDYERMMAAHGYSLDDIVEIQTKAGVGHTPLLELRNLTDVVRSTCEPGKGARIFVKDEAANLAGAFKDRRASVSMHVAKEKGYEGVIAATSGNYGAAVASQAARAGLKCIIVQECYDSHKIGQPEIVEKARICEAYGAEVVQLTVGPELFFHMVELLDTTGYFAASLYSSFGVSGIETLGLEVSQEMRALTGADPTACVITHAGGGNTTGTARGLKLAGASDTQIVSASVDLSGLHMASDNDFNRKSFTTGHTGFGVPFATWPDRADVPRNAARPLRYIDRYLTVTQGEVFYVTEALVKLEGLERGRRQHRHDGGRLARPRAAYRGHHRRAGDRVHRRRQAPLGAAELRQADGRQGPRRRPAPEQAGHGDRHSRAPRAGAGRRLRRRPHAPQLRAQRGEGGPRRLCADARRHRLPGRRHQLHDGRRRGDAR